MIRILAIALLILISPYHNEFPTYAAHANENRGQSGFQDLEDYFSNVIQKKKGFEASYHVREAKDEAAKLLDTNLSPAAKVAVYSYLISLIIMDDGPDKAISKLLEMQDYLKGLKQADKGWKGRIFLTEYPDIMDYAAQNKGNERLVREINFARFELLNWRIRTKWDLALSYFEKAEWFEKRKDTTIAIDLFEQSLKHADDEQMFSMALDALATSWGLELHEFGKAIEYQKALVQHYKTRIKEQTEPKKLKKLNKDLARAYYYLGSYHHLNNQCDLAEKYYHIACQSGHTEGCDENCTQY